MRVDEGVGERDGVMDAVGDADTVVVGDGDEVDVGVDVTVGVRVGVCVCDGVMLAVSLMLGVLLTLAPGESDGVGVAVSVGDVVGDDVGDSEVVDDGLGVGDGVSEGESEVDEVAEGVRLIVEVGLGVALADGLGRAASATGAATMLRKRRFVSGEARSATGLLLLAKQQEVPAAPQQLPVKEVQGASFITGQNHSCVVVATTTCRTPEPKSRTVETLTIPFDMLLPVPGSGVMKIGGPHVEDSEAQLK